MEYENIKTGAIIDSSSVLLGKTWVPVDGIKPTPEQKPKAEAEEEEEVKEETVETDDFDLTKMTVDELKTFATENDIELTATKKAEIIEEIAKAFEM